MYTQRTIKKQVSCSGIGLHTGHPVTMTFLPASPNSGILFKRIDIDGHPILKVQARSIGDLSYATTLAEGGVTVKTIEHVLSAAAALRITNLLIELDSNEPPILDGSAACFINMLLDAGVTTQRGGMRVMRVRQPLDVRHKDSIISIEPHDGLKVTYTIDFPNPFIGTQTKSVEITPMTYMEELAHARTFCMYEEIEYLWKMGLSKGGSLDNAVVFAHDRILNNSLRYQDEPVRHKILDLIGDLMFLGHPLLGHIKTYKGGHLLHARFVKELLSRPDCWEYVAERELSDTGYFPLNAEMFKTPGRDFFSPRAAR